MKLTYLQLNRALTALQNFPADAVLGDQQVIDLAVLTQWLEDALAPLQKAERGFRASLTPEKANERMQGILELSVDAPDSLSVLSESHIPAKLDFRFRPMLTPFMVSDLAMKYQAPKAPSLIIPDGETDCTASAAAMRKQAES